MIRSTATILALLLLGPNLSAAPPERCGPAHPPCDASAFCRQFDGTCEGDGFCESIPASCTPDAAPVCTCAGVSYANECEALRAEQSIDSSTGPCAADDCSGQLCLMDEFCRTPDGVCEGSGGCEPTPTSCPPTYAPVCSCAGVSYWNECEARAAGQSIAGVGACAADGCDGEICADGEFCDASCDPNHPHPPRPTCTPIPESCPPLDDPVCGCDGAQHPNACEAAALSVSVRFPFPCPENCAGLSGTVCSDPSQSCVQQDICGFDVPGVCLDPPASCDGLACRPVCTCNGELYGNRCLALQEPITTFETINISPHQTACEEIRGVAFDGPASCSWSPDGSALHYNVYRAIRSPQAPPGAWDCLQSELSEPTSTIAGAPPVGTVWLIGVTAVQAGGERTLGFGSTASGCAERQITAGCAP